MKFPFLGPDSRLHFSIRKVKPVCNVNEKEDGTKLWI